ncbi:hypothetical protein HU230_0012660 [Bradyrhizobium quebecense]|uniref:Uncharacterized protein n=1 Tax=Bradyrhizobium quebecense TaxID=2748629 RepID=A0A974ADK6_9BRAD|nr:hypothetical protein [Bradyrhizobium quebecense]UGA46841.1 hypothetical protein HU230_0012660 [Bradyrhizobium quebecense]
MKYDYVFGDDGDYIHAMAHDGFDWVTQSVWLIPGTECLFSTRFDCARG